MFNWSENHVITTGIIILGILLINVSSCTKEHNKMQHQNINLAIEKGCNIVPKYIVDELYTESFSNNSSKINKLDNFLRQNPHCLYVIP